jgi:membrane protease YdiL (CAAX protease family)
LPAGPRFCYEIGMDSALSAPLPAVPGPALGGPAFPATRRPPRDGWGGVATSLWGVAILAVMLLGGMAGMALDLLRLRHTAGAGASLDSVGSYIAETATRTDSAVVVSVATCGAVVPFVFWAARLSRVGAAEYLALRAFRSWDLLGGVGAVTAVLVGSGVVFERMRLDGSSPWASELFKDALARGMVVPLVLTLVLCAPLLEETVFRGFLFRGWAASSIRPAGAIVLTSAFWTLLHTQYGAPLLAVLFCEGLVLGYLRHRSGSTLLPMAVHALLNLYAALELGALGDPGA